MFWIVLLITILVAGGNSQSPYVIPKIEKVIETNITDKERKNELKEHSKAFIKEWKEKKKTRKRSNKEQIDLMKDRSVTSEKLQEVLNGSLEEMKEFDKKLGDMRMIVQEKLTNEEWSAIMEDIKNEKPKKTKKREKGELKAQLSQNENFEKLRQDIGASFEDSTKIKKAQAALDRFEDALAELLYEQQDHANQVVDIMYGKNATREQVGEITNTLEELTRSASKALLVLRSELIRISDDDTWPSLAKGLGDFMEF